MELYKSFELQKVKIENNTAKLFVTPFNCIHMKVVSILLTLQRQVITGSHWYFLDLSTFFYGSNELNSICAPILYQEEV